MLMPRPTPRRNSEVVVADVAEALIDALANSESYAVNEVGDDPRTTVVRGYSALNSAKQAQELTAAIAEADIVTTAVGAHILKFVAPAIAAGSLAKKMGVEEGYVMKRPIVEFYYKNDDLGDPMINADYAEAFGLATDAQVAEIKAYALKINEILKAFLAERKVRLIDFKMEFGVDADGKVILADEITPDTSRLWDWDTNEKLDKDRFRRDMGSVEEAYQEIIKRLTGR